MEANQFISNTVLDAAMQPELSDREKALRDLFVQEYLKDYDAFAACLRCGFMRSFAGEYAQRFMTEPYVRQQIEIYSYVKHEDPKQQEQVVEYNRQRIMNGLFREAHYHGPGASHAARVAALTKLAILHEMVPEKKKAGDEGAGSQRGGVMAVPGIASVDDWEQAAVTSQERLVQDV